jgi:hypothetical protein
MQLLDLEPHNYKYSYRRAAGFLPIIGPRRVGKSTLVEHACNDDRVRDHFSQIVFFTRNDIAGESSASSLLGHGGGGVVRHRNCHLGVERMLIVVELDGDRLTESPTRITYARQLTARTRGSETNGRDVYMQCKDSALEHLQEISQIIF